MQREFTQCWGKLCQSASKPFMEWTELNMNTINKLSQNACVQKLSQAKNPEQIFAAQMELAQEACQEATKYAQTAMEIGLCALMGAGKVWAEALRETSQTTSGFAHMSDYMGMGATKAGTTKSETSTKSKKSRRS